MILRWYRTIDDDSAGLNTRAPRWCYCVAASWALLGLPAGLTLALLLIQSVGTESIATPGMLLLNMGATHGITSAAAVAALKRHSPFPLGLSLNLADSPIRMPELIQAIRTVAIAYPLVLLLTALTAVVWQGLGFTVSQPPLIRIASGQGGMAFWLALILATVVVAPIAEEFLFRLVLYEAVAAVRLPHPALICSLLFGLVHFTPVQLPGLALFGLLLQKRRTDSGGLRQPILTHALFNSIAILLLALLKILDIDLAPPP